MALSLRNVTRSFGPLRVLDEVSLDVPAGRVVALVGENGAGKSTLIRCACGLVAPDAGGASVDGAPLPPGDARAAIAAGVGVVHQHFMLVPTLTVADNVALGAEPRTGFLGLRVDRDAVRRRVETLAAEHGLPVDPGALVGDLAVGERQRVEVLKVLFRGAKTVLFDEPTAVLSPREVGALLDTLRALAASGRGVLFVSHKLDEVFAVADEVVVLRRGRVTLTGARAELTPARVTEALLGGAPKPHDAPSASPRAGDGLSLTGLEAPGVGPVTLSVAPGEVVGIAGVEGNGQRPLAEAIVGLLAARGTVSLKGRDVTAHDVAARRAAGLGFVPEDREGRGLISALSVAENVLLGDPDVASRGGRFDRAEAEKRATEVIRRFDVRPPSPWAAVGELSGGNQQKVLLGRELTRDLAALVVAQPTRGVDLGAAAEIHAALRGAAAKGVAVLLVSSELDELRALAHRVVVMRRGAVVGELPVAEASDARLGELMVGGAS
ncbi:MAG: ABC transporter ATP-binding protein [Polyangiales bacterium]